MGLVCLILGSLATSPAHAQGPPRRGSAGWVGQPVVVQGTVTSTYTDAQGHTSTGGGPFSTLGGFASPGTFDIVAGTSETYKVSGTVTYTWKWQGGTNNVPPPTAPQYILEQGNAGAYGTGDARGTVTATASDGLGDDNPQRSASPDGTTQTVSDMNSGKHLVSLDGSSGTLTAVGTLSAESDLSEPAGGGGDLRGSVGCNFTAALDDRSVAIASSLDPTWHKDPATGNPVQNVRTASGFMAADTVAPDTTTTVIVRYSPIYAPTLWGAGSKYLWHSNNHPPDSSGTFNTFLSPDVSSPFVYYNNPPTTPGSNDYITLTLTDSADGATASNNYSVLFHDYYEQWKRTATKTHPGAFTNPDGSHNSEWTRLVVNDNDSPASPAIHLSTAYTDSITETGTIGTQGSLTAPGVAALQRNENITNGQTVTGTVTTTYDFAGYPWSRISYYVAKTYEERAGTTDAYLGNGFQGTQKWYAISATAPMYLSLHTQLEYSYPPH